MPRIVDPAEVEKKEPAIVQPKKWGFWRILGWIIIILGVLFIIYLIY